MHDASVSSALPSLLGHGLVVYRADGTFVHFDDTFVAQLGRTADELAGTNYWALTAPGQKQSELNNLLSGPTPFEKEFLLPDGTTTTARLFGGVRGSPEEQLFFAYVYRGSENASDSETTARVLRHQNAILLSLNQNAAIDEGHLDEALRAITEAGAAGLRCERQSIWLYADGETKIVMHDLFQKSENLHSNGASLEAKDFPGYFQALAEDRTIAANDAHTHPATREFSEIYLKPLNISSMLEAPIRLNGKLLGVLCTENVGPMRTFSQEEQNFAANVADFVGRALQAKARRDYEEALRETNANLEHLVAERTAALQLVLDSMGDALLVVDRTGALTGERSRVATDWFGTCEPGARIWDYLADGDATFRENFRLGFEEITEGFLPFEITSEQAPKRMYRGDRTYQISYRQVLEGGELARVVVVLSDVTEELVRREAEQAARELPQIVTNLLWNTDGFRGFIDETESLLTELSTGTRSPEIAKRHLHTIKGNTAIQGFASLSGRVHELESRVEELGTEAISAATIGELREAFHRALAPVSAILDQQAPNLLRVLPEEHRALLTSLERELAYTELRALVHSWKLPRTDALLSPLVGQGKRMAERLGKEVDIELHASEPRLPNEGLTRFFGTLVHVFRNALDHGVETPEERVRSGKGPRGRVAVTAARIGDDFVVEIRDDGRGIDWEMVRTKAVERGLPSATREDLERALFVDGLSTRDEVTALSGRGVGLAATLEACVEGGGRCTVESALGHGTTFRFTFTAPATLAVAAE